MTLSPFSSDQYRKRTAMGSHEPCCLCGRETSGLNGAIHVPVDHTRNEFVTAAQEQERGDNVSLFPIGPECVKKWRAEFDATSSRLRMSRGEIVSYDHKGEWCPFCKKAHAGAATCLGHYP